MFNMKMLKRVFMIVLIVITITVVAVIAFLWLLSAKAAIVVGFRKQTESLKQSITFSTRIRA